MYDCRPAPLAGRMVKHLAGEGIQEPTTTEPLEFPHRSGEMERCDSAVAPFTELYCPTGFGQIPSRRPSLLPDGTGQAVTQRGRGPHLTLVKCRDFHSLKEYPSANNLHHSVQE